MKTKNQNLSVHIPNVVPFINLSDFALMDEFPLSQRKHLTSLQEMYDEMNPQYSKQKKGKLRAKKSRKASKVKKPPGKARERLSRLLKSKKLRKKSSSCK
jgi:di/tripeptidase